MVGSISSEELNLRSKGYVLPPSEFHIVCTLEELIYLYSRRIQIGSKIVPTTGTIPIYREKQHNKIKIKPQRKLHVSKC